MFFAIVLAVLVVIVGILVVIIKLYKLENQYYAVKDAVVRFIRKCLSCIFMTIRMIALAITHFFVALWRLIRKVFTRRPRKKKESEKPILEKPKKEKEEKTPKQKIGKWGKEISSRPVLLPPKEEDKSLEAKTADIEKPLDKEPTEEKISFDIEPEEEDFSLDTEQEHEEKTGGIFDFKLPHNIDREAIEDLYDESDSDKHDFISSYDELRKPFDINRYTDISGYDDIKKYSDLSKYEDIDGYDDIDGEYGSQSHFDSLYSMEDMARIRQEAMLREQRKALMSHGDEALMRNFSTGLDEEDSLEERRRAMQEALMNIRREQGMESMSYKPQSMQDRGGIEGRGFFVPERADRGLPLTGKEENNVPHFSLKPITHKEDKKEKKVNVRDFMGKSFFSPKKPATNNATSEQKTQKDNMHLDNIDLNQLPESIKKEIIRKYFTNNEGER